jgi:hypothetical protein
LIKITTNQFGQALEADPEVSDIQKIHVTMMSGIKRIESIPIDAVVTWVNPIDEKWAETRNAWQQRLHGVSPDATHKRRFDSNGEIIASIKSILKCAPWIRRIFLVVAAESQIDAAPESLKTILARHQNRISVIYHSTIMDQDAIPTFNSCAIEAHFDRIPDISEFFLKFDDDMILGRPAAKSDYLSLLDTDGTIRMKVSLSSFKSDALKEYSATSNSLWVRRVATNFKRLERYRKSKKITWQSKEHIRMVSHGPQIISKSIFQELANGIFSAETKETRRNRFRVDGDLQLASWMTPLFAIMTNRAEAAWDSRETFLMVPVASWNRMVASDLDSIMRDPPIAFCVNNAMTTDDDNAVSLLQDFLRDFERYFADQLIQ